MTYHKEIQRRLQQAFSPLVLEIINESEKHQGHVNGPQENQQAESHFFIKIVSAHFNNMTRLERHRLIYKVLADYMPNPLHALRLNVLGDHEYP